jgi:DNA-binding transcriptional LysR family regulator
LAGFAQKYPGITVTLREGDQEEMISAMLAGRIEIALAYSLAVPDEIEAEPLIDLPPYAIVASHHPLAGRQSVSLRELADEPFILLDLPHSREYFFGLFRSAGIEPRIVFKSRSQELIRGLVAHGHGFAIQNAIPATTIAYDGNSIAVLALEETLLPTRIMTLRLKHYATRPAVQAFQTYVHEAFSPEGLFAPGSITPPGVDLVKRRKA